MSGAIPNPKYTPPVRRPVGVAVVPTDAPFFAGCPIVVCDDGQLFVFVDDPTEGEMWLGGLAIPGTLADQPARPVDPAQTDLLAQLRQEAYERVGGTVAALRQALIGDVRSPLVDDLSAAVAALVTHMERKP